MVVESAYQKGGPERQAGKKGRMGMSQGLFFGYALTTCGLQYYLVAIEGSFLGVQEVSNASW